MKCGRFTLKFDRTLVMGVLNVTPDSFSDGNKYFEAEKAVKRALQMIEEGADIIDIGGESSRPGSEPVSAEEELKRVMPVIEALADKIDVPISIDTYKPEVAEECLKAGASILNDITGLANPEMRKAAARHKAPVVVMHMQGMPKTMQENPKYDNIVKDIIKFFETQIRLAKEEGVESIIIDPGIGFGKTLEHNLTIIKRLNEFKKLKCPVLIGPSRKSFIGKITGLDVNERLEGTIAAVAASVLNGADIVRVHDVKECKRAIAIAEAIMRAA